MSLVLAPTARADWRDDVGYTQLVSTLNSVGMTAPQGDGVPISLVEALVITSTVRNYKPSPLHPEFNADGDPNLQAVVFVDGSNNSCQGTCLSFSSHANGTGGFMFGNSSLAPAANTVTLYEANHYLSSILHAPNGQTPEIQNYRVQNFSWVGTFDDSSQTPPTPQQLADDVSALRRFDYLINRDNVTAVVGLNNSTAAMSRLLTQSYNSIAVGKSDGVHGTGLTNIADYGPGRSKPDLVGPQNTSSNNTATASSIATFLHSAVVGTDASKSQVIKAMLMAGATKNEFPTWTRSQSQPLDDTFGAGEMNVFNSYLMTLGGRYAGSTEPSSAVGSYGWDYQSISPGPENQLKYNIVIPTGSTASELSVLLNWNVDVSSNFTGQVLANLDLTLTDSLGQIVDQSLSTVDNVEHIYIGAGQGVTHLDPGTYTLTISTDTSRDFGLAWRTSTLADVESADFDADGDVDGRDFIAWQRGFGKLVNATRAEGDANGDGDVDQADLAVYQAQFLDPEPEVPPPLLAAFAVPEPTTVAFAASGLLVFLLGRRRSQAMAAWKGHRLLLAAGGSRRLYL